MPPRRILFVCYGNLCRSPMAEGFFNAWRGKDLPAAESAGVGALDGTPATPLAVLEMQRQGIDISGHRARNVASVDLDSYEEIIAVDREVALLLETIAPRHPFMRIWNIADPYGGSARGYRDAAENLHALVGEYLRVLTGEQAR
jgi:protein-tyrosine-phosphatase